MAHLELRDVGKVYPNGTSAVDGVSLSVDDEEMVALVGPSGCGKSSLLRIVAGLEDATTGRVLLSGRDVTGVAPGRRDVAMVFQSYALYPFKSVFENLAFALRVRGLAEREVERRVRDTAERLGIAPLLDLLPAKLSGGQQQRVALGRALVREPELFLFDEPLSNLDANLRRTTRKEIRRLQLDTKTAALYVTHDQEEAMSIADRLAVMDRGKLRQIGTPSEIYERPANRFVAGFIGSPPMNVLLGEVVNADGRPRWSRPGFGSIAVPGAVCASLGSESRAALHVGFRPESLSIEPAADSVGVALRVTTVELLGEVRDVTGTTGDGAEVTARVRSAVEPRIGDVVELRLPHDRVHWFENTPEARRLG